MIVLRLILPLFSVHLELVQFIETGRMPSVAHDKGFSVTMHSPFSWMGDNNEDNEKHTDISTSYLSLQPNIGFEILPLLTNRWGAPALFGVGTPILAVA